jgi:transcriptional regulator with XRE-family HTH domain
MAKSFDSLVAQTTTKETQRRAKVRTIELLQEMLLREIRAKQGKSQSQLASALGISQPSVAKLERQSDMQVSTLYRTIQAMGGELEIVARFPSAAVRVRLSPQTRLQSQRKSRLARKSTGSSRRGKAKV